MALTPNLSTVTITGTFVDIQGNPIAGQVKFTPRATLKDAAANQIVIPKTITVDLDANGSFSTVLPVTDDTSLSPVNFTYRVEESFPGGRVYDLAFPTSAGSVDLADLVPAVSSTGTEANLYVSQAAYTSLNNRVIVVEATVTAIGSLPTQITTATNAASTAATAATSAATSAAQVANYPSPFLLMGV